MHGTYSFDNHSQYIKTSIWMKGLLLGLFLQLNMELIGLNMILQRDNIGALLKKSSMYKL